MDNPKYIIDIHLMLNDMKHFDEAIRRMKQALDADDVYYSIDEKDIDGFVEFISPDEQ